MEQPLVSVIIPVFNDTAGLQQCLVALDSQTYPQSRYEVIVIDNGSDQIQAIESLVANHRTTRLVHESTPGSYAARNRGIAVATGEILAFTDADCIPNDDWLMTGVTTLTSISNCGLVAGRIKMLLQNPTRPTAVELYESIRALPQNEFVNQAHFGATANIFTYRQVFHTVGLFDSSLKSSGDLEWGQRVYAAGYQQVYAEACLVQHPTHTTLQSFCARARRLVGGHYDLQMKRTQTYWQRQSVFLRGIFMGLFPYVNSQGVVATLLSDAKTKSIVLKAKMLTLLVLSRCVSSLEIMRLKVGGFSKRA
ncbi:MAG: glycosyltransferase [Cyanobacteria bacterium P01_D01_bin.6]